MNKAHIDDVIARIKKALPTYHIKPENLKKFKGPEDTDCLGYVNGVGGSYIKFLSLLIKELKPKTIVELGNLTGMSTMSMYDALPAESTFTTLDILHDQRYCPDAMFSDPRVTFLFGDDCDASMFKKIPMDINLLFSDTIHYNFQITDEFEIYQHFLADEAIVAIDDIHKNDKGLFWDRVTYPKWDLTELCHTPSGWGLFLYTRTNKISEEERMKLATQAAAKIWKRKHDELEAKLATVHSKKISTRVKNLIKKNPFLYKTGVKLINLKSSKKF